MKMLGIVLLALLMCGVAHASQVQNEIITETLSTTNSAVEGDLSIEDSSRVAFFVNIDNNRTTASVTAIVTAAVSLNGTDWTDISWRDTAGGVTPVTSEVTANAVQQYAGFLDNSTQAKFIRIRVNANQLAGTDNAVYTADDNATLSVTVVQDK